MTSTRMTARASSIALEDSWCFLKYKYQRYAAPAVSFQQFCAGNLTFHRVDTFLESQRQTATKSKMLSKCLALVALLTYVSAEGPASSPVAVKEALEGSYGPLRPPNCGASKILDLLGIVNGEPAKLGAWPWIAALGYRNASNPLKPKFLCGGTLISRRHVLTAAHCVTDPDLYMVRIGDLDLESDQDGAFPVELEIEQKIVHPEYDSKRQSNDIAVLKLMKDVILTDYIQPICLPVDDPLRRDDFYAKNAYLAGWGATSFQGPASSILLQAQVPVVSIADCKSAYSGDPNRLINNRTICAGLQLGGKDACDGDRGGPLMLVQEKSVYLIGVDSFGYKCAEPGFPTVYSRVTEYLDFILPLLG